MGITCQAQDYIKPQRLDTIPCQIGQVDANWIYYTINGQPHKYKKTDVEAYSYNGNWVIVEKSPPVSPFRKKAKPNKPVYTDYQTDSMAGSLLEEAGWNKMASGVLKIFGSLQFTKAFAEPVPEKRLSASVGGFVLFTVAYVLDIAAANNQRKAGNQLKHKGREHLRYEAELKLRADSLSR